MVFAEILIQNLFLQKINSLLSLFKFKTFIMTSFDKNTNNTKSPYNFNGITTRPPPSSYKQMESRAGKPLGTGAQGGIEGRPVTSNKGVGFTSKNLENKANQLLNTKTKFDVNKKVDNNPEQNFKKMEKQINNLIEESATCKIKGSFTQALQKAKQAVTKQKNLRKAREASNAIDMVNIDLSYCVLFNLAISLQANGMIQEALTKYTQIIKSKQFPQAGRLRVNMGNIYFQQKKYPTAIKMYRMALDIIPTTSKQMRFKIQKNIGHAFIKLGQFQDAITSYQNIMKGSPDHKIAFNLLLCLYASGDKLRMKDCFSSMLINENEQQPQQQDQQHKNTNDKLKEQLKEKRREQLRLIIMASKLIAPVIESDIILAYDWILEKLKSSSYPQAQSQVQIFKALALLKKKQIDKAIQSLKTLEKKDSTTMGRVASNISFLHFLQNDYKSAEKYVDMALSYDRYNAKALVNKGNCLFMKNDFMRAKQQYLQAIGVEADCVQALYNLGYVNKKLNLFMEALQALQKLQTIIAIPQAIFQIANIQEIIGNTKQALKWYQVLVTKVPNDAGTLARIGNIFFRDDDEQQALHYYMESYRLLPTNIDTNIWIGIYYVKQGIYEKACYYLQRASQLQPKEVKWRLMVASCQRRIGNFQKALKIYESIYQQYPDNIQCLRFLVLLCKDMGRDYEQYAKQLSQLQLDNAAKAGYENPNLQDFENNKEPEKQEEQNLNIRISDNNTRRKQLQIKKVQKQDEGWGDEIDADAMGLS